MKRRILILSALFVFLAPLCAEEGFGFWHNYGPAYATVTRIQKQSGWSNFVWNDKMAGLFYELQTHDFHSFGEHWALNFMGRMAAYYPFQYTFREVPQTMTQVILFGLDWFTAPAFTFDLKWVRFDMEPGVHVFYQMNDMWHYVHLGIGAKLDIELPVSRRWTLSMGGMVSWDYGNLGTNRVVREFDFVWEYQLQVGVRYSKSGPNATYYAKSRR